MSTGNSQLIYEEIIRSSFTSDLRLYCLPAEAHAVKLTVFTCHHTGGTSVRSLSQQFIKLELQIPDTLYLICLFNCTFSFLAAIYLWQLLTKSPSNPNNVSLYLDLYVDGCVCYNIYRSECCKWQQGIGIFPSVVSDIFFYFYFIAAPKNTILPSYRTWMTTSVQCISHLQSFVNFLVVTPPRTELTAVTLC